MDPIPMQQAVMETPAAPVLLPPSAPEGTDGTESPPANADQAYEPLSNTYDELFPALPIAQMIHSSSPDVQQQQQQQQSAPAWGSNSTKSMRIASSVITQVFHVPFEERAKIDGGSTFGESASQRICADITAKTGAHIEISAARDQSQTFLVTGKNDSVLKARRLILEKFQTQARHIIHVPKDHHRFVLGKKGKKLQDLEALTATKIQVPPASETSDEIVVVGPKEGIEKAIHEITLITDEQSKQAYEKLEVPKVYHPFICGGNNEKIQALMGEHNVRINVPPPSVMKNELTVAGEKEGVGKCKEIIMKCYAEMERKCQTVSVEVRKSQHRYVIGHRRSNIAEILQQTGVSVEMPSTDSTSETITLRGPQDKLGQALTQVYAKANSVVSSDVDAPAWLHKFIIGRKGANIKQITADLPKVHVEFTEKQGRIKMEGPPEEVEAAREKLEGMINEMMNKLAFDEIVVDPKYHKHIIGKSGANINRIRNETGVLINISASEGNIIRLEGNPEGVKQAKQELQEMVAKMENEKERDIIIEQRFHRTIIGTRGETIREIREKFNQVQISFPDPGDKSDIVKIRGPKEDVDQCHRHLQRMSKDLLESAYQVKVPIFKQFLKNIVGKNGNNIKKIREETNTRLDIPQPGQSGDEIVITGKKENVEKAVECIQKIQEEQASIVQQDIIIPAKFHNSMIGPGGKLIQSVSEECGGVHIKFPPPDSKSDKVAIRGPKEDVAKAKGMLVEMSQQKAQNSHTAEVRAKPQIHRFLIGRNGVNIKKIRDATGARIVFPSDNDADKTLILIIGKKEEVAKAKTQLETVIKELDNVAEETMTVDPKYHRYFVVRRGEILRNISDQFGGVSVSFPRSGVASDKVTLKGAKECVAGAKARIQELVHDLEQQVTIDVIIPQKYHRTVMGPRGSRVQAVTQEFSVQIKFPDKEIANEMTNGDMNGDEDRPQDIVRITGKKDHCESARDALLDLVPIIEEIAVPFEHHRYIIGQKGDNVRRMMQDYDVSIQVPPASDESDIIRLTGRRTNVDDAKIGIMEKVKDLDAEKANRLAKSFQLTLVIDPEYHPKIIGKRGAVISKIRETHDVNIQFPRRGESSDNIITITGYEKNAKEAEAAILDIVGDLDSMVKVTVEIDPRIHSRLIGARGRAIRSIMSDFKVDIKFPRDGDEPNIVTIMGMENAVLDCKEHLLNLAEEYLQDLDDEDEMNQYIATNQRGGPDNAPNSQGGKPRDGFVVVGAPWEAPPQSAPKLDSSEDFPSMGGPGLSAQPTLSSPAWGPRR